MYRFQPVEHILWRMPGNHFRHDEMTWQAYALRQRNSKVNTIAVDVQVIQNERNKADTKRD